MLSGRFRLSIAAAILLSITVVAPAQGASLTVTLDGASTSLAEARSYHCHDLTRSQLTCFRSPTARDRAVADLLAGGAHRSGPSRLSLTSGNGYVIAYAAITYGGASVVLSQDYGNLGTIGWDNIISSYKVFTNLTGAFYENAWYGGRTQYFCCYTNVSYVGDAYNDIFTSIDLP